MKKEDLLPPHITCHIYSKDFEGSGRIIEFVRHLRLIHDVIELDNHPRHKILKAKYIIVRNKGQ